MEKQKLQKNHLNYIEVMALSVAIMAPTAAMALNISLMAGVSSYSVSLVQVIAVIAVGCVAVSFIQFNKHFSSAGSVYYFTTKSLGEKTGFISGWLLLLTYFMFTAASTAETGSFLESFFKILGLHTGWLIIALFCVVGVWIISLLDVRISTRIMLALEAFSIAMILILCGVIFVKVGFRSGLSLAPFKMNGNNISSIGQAVVFGFMSFVGFEGASSLGEESKNPQKTIPFALLSAVFLTGIFYMAVSYAQVIGFGINVNGIKHLANSSSPLGDLASKYISNSFALVIMFGASLSAFSCALGCASAGSRMIYSMGISGRMPKCFSKIHSNFKTPYIALSVIMIASCILNIVLFSNPGATVFGDLGTIGVLSILLAYLLTNIGALKLFIMNGEWRGLRLVIPIVSVVIIAYTVYSNIYPVPSFPMNIFPYIVLAWIIGGVVILSVTRSGTQKEGEFSVPILNSEAAGSSNKLG